MQKKTDDGVKMKCEKENIRETDDRDTKNTQNEYIFRIALITNSPVSVRSKNPTVDGSSQ